MVEWSQVEQAIWRLSGWQVDQRSIDELRPVVEAYATDYDGPAPVVGITLQDCGELGHTPCCAPLVETEAAESVPEPPAAVESIKVPPGFLGDGSGAVWVFLGMPMGSGPAPVAKESPAARLHRANKDRAAKTQEGVPEGHKRCHRCEVVKVLEDYRRDNRQTDGFRGTCKKCMSKAVRGF